MANVNRPNGFTAVKTLGGGAIPLFTMYTKSNLTLAPGDAIVMLTNGTAELATVSSSAIYGVCQSVVTAVAATRQAIKFVPAADNIVFSAQYGTASHSATTQNFGVSHDIGGTTGVQVLTSTTASGAPARILMVEPSLTNAVGQYERVLFTWQKSQWTGQA